MAGMDDESRTKTVQNPPLSELEDGDTPTLTSLVLFEVMKWGAIVVIAFILWRFLESLGAPVIELFYDEEESADVS